MADLTPHDYSTVAAVDLGSNSFHVIIARIADGAIQPLYKNKERVRLADGLDDKNKLSDEAIERGVKALTNVADALSSLEMDNIRVIGTYTLRAASNSKKFVKRAAEVFPYPIEIVPGTEEARLIYQGVASTHSSKGRRIVIDIGGGSTELAAGEGFDTALLRSLHMGSVSFTEAFFSDGTISPKAYKKAFTAAKQELELVEDKYKNFSAEDFIGCSGTIRNLSVIASNNDAGSIDRKQLTKIKEKVLSQDHVSKLSFDGVSEQRCQVLPAGIAILDAIFDSLNIDFLDVSDAALREGVLHEMEERLLHHDIREKTVSSVQKRYYVDIEQAERVESTATMLYQQFKKDCKINKPELSNLLQWAAKLHEIGIHINSRGYQKHSAYIIANEELPGFNQEEQQILSILLRCCRNKLKPELVSEEFSMLTQGQLINLIRILRLAVLFNIKRLDNFHPELKASADKKTMSLLLDKEWFQDRYLLQADLEKESEHLALANLDLILLQQ